MADDSQDKPRGRHKHQGFIPGKTYRGLRYLTQSLALIAVIAAPFLGGWQRIERNFLSAWYSRGWDLPPHWYDVLPGGETARKVYEANVILGGGAASDYFGVPALDPVAGFVALVSGAPTWHTLLAFGIPVILALLFGRLFCGWFCPFGVIARLVDKLVGLLPFGWHGFAIPKRRPIRWIVLAVSVVAGIIFADGLLYIFLPHLLVQQSGYSIWLLGGGGAVLGAFLGLLAAGVLMGPTLYCATICRTGAALSLFSRFRRFRIDLIDESACGACELCSRACWLGLEPYKGDPGPDCDLCTRCFSACPRTNMQVIFKGLGPETSDEPDQATSSVSKVGVVLVSLFAAFATFGLPDAAAAQQRNVDAAHEKPTLLLNGIERRGDSILVVSVVDRYGMIMSPDAPPETGVEVSAFLARGEIPEPDQLGRKEGRDVYEGPLEIELRAESGELLKTLSFERPNSPRSTPRRTIYRRRVDMRLPAGTRLAVSPVEGWLDAGKTWTIRENTAGSGVGCTVRYAVAGTLLFFGLLSIALAYGRRPDEDRPTSTDVAPARGELQD